MDMPQKNAFTARIIIGSTVLAAALWLLPLAALAASLSIVPAGKTVTVGQIFTVSAYVSSPDEAMNAASGDISFPSDKLQVLSVSKANSVMNLWIREPSFTNSISGGDVHFEGVVLNPGYIGVAGDLIDIRFQAIGSGNAPVKYTSGAILANDGNGTNILTAMDPGVITINPKAAAQPTPTPTPIQGSNGSSTAATSTETITTSTEVNVSSTLSATTTEPNVEVTPIPTVQNPWENTLRFIIAWGLVGILLIAIIALLVFLSIYLIHKIRKWKVSSSRELLALEARLHQDIKRIEKELILEKRVKNDPLRKKIEHIESDIDKL